MCYNNGWNKSSNICSIPYINFYYCRFVEFDTRIQWEEGKELERHFRLERVYPVQNNKEVALNKAGETNSSDTFLNKATSIDTIVLQNSDNFNEDSTGKKRFNNLYKFQLLTYQI